MSLPAGASFATVSTLAADLGNTVIFASLVTGGCLHVISRSRLSEAAALADAFERHPIDCLKIVPSHLTALLASPRAAGCLPRRLLILGGEAAPPGLIQRVLELAPGCRILNHYGPTETTVGVLTCETGRRTPVPLGRPLAGTRVLVLDRGLGMMPPGVPGELYAGGPQVTRGYLRQPDLTAERFVPDPWGAFYGQPGSRLYATGDRGRYLADGAVEFLGRMDFQVKVRGFRVEPGEVEAALRLHPGVGEAVVTARDQRLTAYVVAQPGMELTASDLRAFLKERLPDPLVPTSWAFLPALPLTPNGKVDRKALPAPDELRSPVPSAAPSTPTEELLATLWAGVLGLDRVGIHEGFFELGGHSLLAIQVVSRVRASFGIELPLQRLFENPTIAGLSRIIDSATDLAPAGEAWSARPERLPLSFSQQSLWLVERLQPADGAYNLPTALRLEGTLDAAALATALGGVVSRHESLRTRFAETDGEPWQEILPASAEAPWLPLADLSGLPEGRREEEALRAARAEAGRAFDLTAGPLLRALLVRLGPAEHLFLLVVHHAVSDGWSDQILLGDLAIFYQAAFEGRPAELPRLPLQYADYAIWQRQHLCGETLAKLLAVWRRRLAGVPPIDLPTDRRRPPVWTFRGASRGVDLEVSAADLEGLARSWNATSFMVALTVLQALLGRYTGQNDFAVGTPSANRARYELEGLVGFFVNMLPLRADLSGAPVFGELLTRVRDTTLEAFANQDLPFELLVEDLAPERDLGRNPLFQVALQFGYRQATRFPGLAARRFDLGGGGTAKFDLNLSMEQGDGRLVLFCEYPLDLFEDATIQRLLGHFQVLFAAGIAEPGRAVGDLPLLTESERAAAPGRASTIRGSTSGPEVCLHQLFEGQVERTPERTALVAPEGTRLTYRELNERADRLARRLRALGLGPERLAGVLMDRTADLVVALLAVLKAGGAYAPLDPNYPQSRVLLMLETSRAAVLVTRRRLAAAFEGELPAGMRTLFLDPGWDEEPIEEPCVESLPDNLAYVIFTSGSTGVPKGVAIQHRSAVAMVRWAHAMYTPEEYAGVLASTSICFDMSVFEIFATLAAGGKIVLAENALALPDLEARDEVVLVDTVPSAMSELLRLGGLPSTVRTVNLGGEALKGSLVREIYGQLPGVERVVNLYGPSEDTTFTSYAVVPRDAEHPLIGRPLTGEAAYVLDAAMRPVPVGIPGALYMGGEGVTRGYLHRPDLTAERFIPNPYGPPGSRLYQVGDLVRYLPTGELDFLGRLDTQVKVRGFRIELGEIESALTRHPEVWEAAVLAMPDEVGGNRLIAYVESARDLTARELRSFLKQSLPDYMVPSVFVPLRELPLTPNGKIDRRALAALPLHAEESEAAGSRAPRNYVEEVLAGIWSDVFGQAVGVTDHFFDLGGHSLLATRVVSRMREAFGIELPVRRSVRAADRRRARRERRGGTGRGRSPGGADYRADPPHRPAAALLFPAAPLVPRPARPRLRGLQHPLPAEAGRATRPADPSECVRGLGAPARGVAHDLPWPRRRAVPGDRAGRVLPVAGDRHHRPARGPAECRGRVSHRERVQTAVRSWLRAALPGDAAEARTGAARPPAGDAPHRLRWLVAGDPAPGAGCAVRGLRRGPAVAAPRAAGAVRRLRGLAAALAERRGALASARALAPSARRRSRGSRPAHRLSAAGRADLQGGQPLGRTTGGAVCRDSRVLPPGRGDPVHAPARRFRRPARPLLRAGGRAGRLARRQSQPGGDRRTDRLLRQHSGAPGPARRGVLVPECATSGARGGADRLWPPGSPLRDAGGGAAAGTRPLPHPLLPGIALRADGRPGSAGSGRGAARGDRRGEHRGEVRPLPVRGGCGDHLAGGGGVQHRPVRGRDGRPAAGPRRAAARSGGERSGTWLARPAAADGSRARAAPGRVQRHRLDLRSRGLPASALRGPGGTDARADGARSSGRHAPDLPRAE